MRPLRKLNEPYVLSDIFFLLATKRYLKNYIFLPSFFITKISIFLIKRPLPTDFSDFLKCSIATSLLTNISLHLTLNIENVI